jgi:membrane-bound metal-dependent hydrolase YbcI (DUF457 family)
MSWAAHELESYVIQKHLRVRLSFLAILVGCLLPDMFTKLPVYGVHVGSLAFRASQPWRYHRGWPGAGLTHSLLFAVVIALVVLATTRHRGWALGLLVGTIAHDLTDTLDTVGTMLLFPVSTHVFSIGMWSYAGQQGRYGDAAAYYSSLGGVWDAFWLLLALVSWRVFTRQYFFDVVVPSDPVWSRLRRKWRVSDSTLVALYRAYFVYAAARIAGWFLWARFVYRAPLDMSWGGPGFVTKTPVDGHTFVSTVEQTLVAVPIFALLLWLTWRYVGKPLWRRADRGLAVVERGVKPVSPVSA